MIMNIDTVYVNNIRRYIKDGTSSMSAKDYRFLVLSGSLWSIIGLGYGLVLEGYFQYIATAMMIVAFVLIVLTFIFSTKKLTLKKG